MPTVDVERLQIVDVKTSKVGNFMDTANLDRFLNSEVGKAQERLMRQEMQAQGFKPEDITTSMVRRALFSEQASQDTGYRQADLTTAQLMDKAGPAWYERLGSLATNWLKAGDQTVRDGMRAGADATATMVTTNTGYSGQAAEALSGRAAQIENAVNQALGVTPGGRKP